MEIDIKKTWTQKKIQQLRTRLELQQYQYFNGRPLWTSIELENLKLFMAYTYFGYPFEENEEIDESNDDLFSYYSSEIKELISNICDIIKTKMIKQCDSNIEVGITITHSICAIKCDVCNNFPDQDVHQWYLIRIKLNNLNVSYIDLHHRRTYKNFEDYINNNSLPKGILFCSASGYYEESNYLSSYLTPPSRMSKKILSGLDIFGKAVTFSSSILLASGLVFPVMAPVLIPASITIGSISAYDTGRHIYKLTDLSKHNQSLVSKKASKIWFDLGISTLSVFTAPMTTALKTLQLSESALMASRIGKSLTILQSGVCITQCSLEVIRLSMIIKQDKLTIKDLMSLRLDLFIVLGSILPITFFQNILEYMVSVVPLNQAWAIVKQIPYCVGQMLFKSVSYICKHAAEFTASASKFLHGNLTVEKLLSAWVIFKKFLNAYREMVNQLGPKDVLGHVVHDLIEFPPPPRSGHPGVAVWNAELRTALCGPLMRELLYVLAVDPTDRLVVKFCAERVVAEAAAVAARRDEAAADCERYGIRDTASVDREFRRQYAVTGWQEDVDGLPRDDGADEDGRIAASWYAQYGLQAVAADVPRFWCEYREYQSLPENRLNSQLIVDRRSGGGDTDGASSRLRVHELAAPPSGDHLDAATCAQFASVVDPENRDGYHDYRYFAASEVPGTCLLWSASAFSLNVACFSVESPRPGAPASMHVSIYRSSN